MMSSRATDIASNLRVEERSLGPIAFLLTGNWEEPTNEPSTRFVAGNVGRVVDWGQVETGRIFCLGMGSQKQG
jgi:hypothetical protein